MTVSGHNHRGIEYFFNTCDLVVFLNKSCVFDIHSNGLLESHIEEWWREQLHVSPNPTPGLGRTQGCGFWADKNGASVRNEVKIRQKTWEAVGKVWRNELEREEGALDNW